MSIVHLGVQRKEGWQVYVAVIAAEVWHQNIKTERSANYDFVARKERMIHFFVDYILVLEFQHVTERSVE